MKIRKLKIKNYKIFDDVEFDFTDHEGKTLDTVVLAGVNGCGKTTLLELIEGVINGEISPVNVDIVFELEFTASEIKRMSDIGQMGDKMPIGYKNSSGIVITVNWELYLQNKSVIKIGSTDNAYAHNNFIFDSIIKLLKQSDFKSIYLPVKNEESTENKFVERLHLDKNRNELKELVIKQLLESIFKNKTIAPDKNIANLISTINKQLTNVDLSTKLIDIEADELIFESGNGQRIYFEQLSHGEQNLYFRALYLNQMNLKNALILADEPENAFHPTWQQKIVKLYQNVGENNQVFLATHSPHIMSSVHPDNLFILHIDEKTRKIDVINAGKAGKQSKGLEPNRILKEIMQVEELRDYDTKEAIKKLTNLLTIDGFETPEAADLIEQLTLDLGRQDPFIMRLEHRLLMLRRQLQPA